MVGRDLYSNESRVSTASITYLCVCLCVCKAKKTINLRVCCYVSGEDQDDLGFPALRP